MNFEVKVHRKNISNQELIDDLIAVSKKIGSNKVSFTTYLKHGKFHGTTLKTRFGTWAAAVQLAGLKPVQLGRLSEGILFKNLEEVWIKLGRQPTVWEMKAPLSKHGNCSYFRYFGSWNEALRRFAEYKKAQCLTDAQAEEEVKTPGGDEVAVNKRIQAGPRAAAHPLRFAVFLRDGFRCMACGKSPLTHPGVDLQCDHIIPWSKGGRTIMKNLRTLCAECNAAKGNLMET